MTAYRVCTRRDLPQLKGVWLSCFEEREDAAELFFEENASTFHAYACEEDGKIVSALYLIDCTLNSAPAHYLCGAATLPDHRRRGIMAGLITYALEDAKRRGDRYSLLFPASGSLYGFYAKFGYLPTCAEKTAELDTVTERQCCGGSPDLQELQGKHIKDRLIWADGFIRFAADYYACYGAKTAQSADAFAICESDGGFAEVIYALYREIDDLKALLGANGISRFRLTAPANSPQIDGGITKPSGMILPLSGDAPPENVFIGITLQ